MTKSNYIEQFQQDFEKLNPQQKKAVETIFGPVMVIAGPGTGKTQILSLRIANLLLSDAQVQPQNILCLTFTEEGKKNMRDRLFRLIGAETAQHIAVHTYHSYCNEIIQQNISLFHKESLDAVSELEKIQYIKEILLSIPKTNALYNGKDPNKEAKYLLKLFSKMKQENWSASYLAEKTKEYITFLKTDESSISSRGNTKGQIKADILKHIQGYEKSLDAIVLFDEYRKIMLKNQRYDFDDMINWVIKLLAENNDVLSFYQEKYQFLLVDEFQDTNGSQMELINLMSNYDDAPNTFVVGDDDQSIYRFQGASVENMNTFKQKYTPFGLSEICLKTNYRSYQGILDVSKNLIEKAGGRLVDTSPELDKNLVSYHTLDTNNDFQPKLLSFHNSRYEKVFIAKEIQRLINSGVDPKEIAVLYYDNNNCLELAEYLKLLNIPFYTKKNQNLLHDVLSNQVLTILKYISLESQNPYSADDKLFEILHYNFFNIPSIEIAKASILSNQYTAVKKGQKNSFRLYLQEQLAVHNPTLFEQTGIDKLLHAARIIESLIKESVNQSLIQILDTVCEQCQIFQSIFSSKNKYEELEILTALFDFIKDECHRNPMLHINEFIDLIDLMNENDIQIPRTKLYGNENAVRLFTVHASKGREFEYVFVAGCVNTNWEKKRTPPTTVKIPPTVFETALNNKDNDELRRMLYVALTRAKKELYVSYFNQDLKEKDVEKSLFLYEIFGEKYEAEKPVVSNEMIFEFETLINHTDEEVVLQAMEKEFVDKQLSKFEMNVTALNNYLQCPLRFYYNNVVRIPSGLTETMTFGSAIHYALEKLFEDMKKNNQVFPPLERFEDHLKFYMSRNKEKFSPEGFKHKLEYGKDVLKNLYDKNLDTWSKNVDLEVHVKATVNDIPIKGLLDKIEYHEQGDFVIDYKTGDANSSYTKEKFKSLADDKNGVGGDYWRQAIFYKILLDNQHPRKYKAISAQYVFVEPDKKTKELTMPIHVAFKKEHEDQVKQQLTEVWHKIQNHDFYTGCGDEKCPSCNFSRQINSSVLPKS
jgi:DNA helicase-2/ATP-dependent DNA helicase PcrA